MDIKKKFILNILSAFDDDGGEPQDELTQKFSENIEMMSTDCSVNGIRYSTFDERFECGDTVIYDFDKLVSNNKIKECTRFGFNVDWNKDFEIAILKFKSKMAIINVDRLRFLLPKVNIHRWIFFDTEFNYPRYIELSTNKSIDSIIREHSVYDEIYGVRFPRNPIGVFDLNAITGLEKI